MVEDKIRISYIEDQVLIGVISSKTHTKEQKSCPYGTYMKCEHPLIDVEILCDYGIPDRDIPNNCPLRKSALIKKIELIPGV